MPAGGGQLVVFGFASFLALAFALLMVVQKTPVRSVLSLVVTFFALSVLAILLAAPFIAALQIFVYAGAILVLFLFVIMLLNLKEEAADKDDRPVQRTLNRSAPTLGSPNPLPQLKFTDPSVREWAGPVSVIPAK